MNEHAYSYIKPNIATLQTLLDKLKKSKNRQSYRLAIEQMEESDFLITIPEFPSYNIYWADLKQCLVIYHKFTSTGPVCRTSIFQFLHCKVDVAFVWLIWICYWYTLKIFRNDKIRSQNLPTRPFVFNYDPSIREVVRFYQGNGKNKVRETAWNGKSPVNWWKFVFQFLCRYCR